MVVNYREHVTRVEIVEVLPAKFLVRTLLVILPLGKEAFCMGFFSDWPSILGCFLLIQALEKKQIGNLLNDFQRVRNGRPTRECQPRCGRFDCNLTNKHFPR